MAHLFEVAAGHVRRIRYRAPLLVAVDLIKHKGSLLERAAEEVGEYKQKRNLYGTDEFSARAQNDEWGDVGVFGFSWIDIFASDFDFDVSGTVNGYGDRSDALDRLDPVILAMQDDPSAIKEFILRYESVIKHSQVPYSYLQSFAHTLRKVTLNMPPDLYDIYHSSGRKLDDEEAEKKSDHLKKALSWLRKQIEVAEGRERPLSRNDWGPYKPLLAHGWDDSGTNIKRFKERYRVDSQQI